MAISRLSLQSLGVSGKRSSISSGGPAIALPWTTDFATMAGWYPGNSSATVQLSTSYFRTSPSSLQVISSNPTVLTYAYVNVAATPGQTYTVSVWMAMPTASTGGGRIAAMVILNGPTIISTSTPTAGFSNYTGSFTAGGPLVTIGFGIRTPSLNSVGLCIDDLSIT